MIVGIPDYQCRLNRELIGCSLWNTAWYADGFSLVFISAFWPICIVSKAPCNCSGKVVQSSAVSRFLPKQRPYPRKQKLFPIISLTTDQFESERTVPDVSIANKNRKFKNIDHFMFVFIKVNSSA